MPHDAEAAALDSADPLARFRDEFELDRAVIYLDGNSLGPLPKRAREVAARVIDVEWGQGLVRSWNGAAWFDLPRRLGDRLAPLIGARTGEVVLTDTISVNLFKVLAAALSLRPGRRVIVSERDSFPSDLYVAQGLQRLLGDAVEIRLVDAPVALADALDDSVAVLLLGHVGYRTGQVHDLARLTARAHAVGALAIWDLAHSAGVVPIDLGGAEADFAVGCTYKYLNGGPGSPAFLYAAERWHSSAVQPLTGWWAHRAPFAFESEFAPASGVERFLCGTQSVLALSIAEVGLELAERATVALARAKSQALGQRFLERVLATCAGHGLALASPADPEARGAHVSFTHPDGYAIVQALIERGVIADYREPNLMRFGFSPLFLRYADVDGAVLELEDVLAQRVWDQPAFSQRGTVT